MNWPVNPLRGKANQTTDWRAVCGRSACTVRRGEGPTSIGPSYPYHARLQVLGEGDGKAAGQGERLPGPGTRGDSGDAPAGRCTEIRTRRTGATRSADTAPGDAGTVSRDGTDLPLAGRGSLSRHLHQYHGAVPADIRGGPDCPGWSRRQV